MSESRSTPDLSSVGSEAPHPSGEAGSTAALQPPVPESPVPETKDSRTAQDQAAPAAEPKQPSHKEKIFAELPILGSEAPLIKKLMEFQKVCGELEEQLEELGNWKGSTAAWLFSFDIAKPFVGQTGHQKFQQENHKSEVVRNFYKMLDSTYYKIGETGKSGIRDLLGLLSRAITPLLAEETGIRGHLFLRPISDAIKLTEQTVQNMLGQLEQDLEGKQLIERKTAHATAVGPLRESAQVVSNLCTQLARLCGEMNTEERSLNGQYKGLLTESEGIKEFHNDVDKFWQTLKSKVIAKKLPQKAEVVLEDKTSEEHVGQVRRLDEIMQSITTSLDDAGQIRSRTQQYKSTLDALAAEYNTCEQRLGNVNRGLAELKILDLEGRVAEIRASGELDQVAQLRAEIKLKKEQLSGEKNAAQVVFCDIKKAIEQAEAVSDEKNKTKQFRTDKQKLQAQSAEFALLKEELRTLKEGLQSKIDTLRQAVLNELRKMTSLQPNNLSDLEGAVKQLREIKSQHVHLKAGIEGMHEKDKAFVLGIQGLLKITIQLQQALDLLKSQVAATTADLQNESGLKQEIKNLLDDEQLVLEFDRILATRRTEEYYQNIFAQVPFGEFKLSGTIYRDFTIAIMELSKRLELVKQDQLQFGNAGIARRAAEGRVVPSHEIAVSYGEHGTCLVPAIDKYTAFQRATKEFIDFLNQLPEVKHPLESGAGREIPKPCSSILLLIDDLGMQMARLHDDLVKNACTKLMSDVVKLKAAKDELDELIVFFKHTKEQYQSLPGVISEVDSQMKQLQVAAAQFEALVVTVGQLPHARTEERTGEKQKPIAEMIAGSMVVLDRCLQIDETCREACKPAKEQVARIEQEILPALGRVERVLSLLQGDRELSEVAQCELALAQLGAKRADSTADEKRVTDRINLLETKLAELENSLNNIEALKKQETDVVGQETAVKLEHQALQRRRNDAVNGELYKRLLRKFLYTGKSREKLEELRQHKEAKHQRDIKGGAIDTFLTAVAATTNLADLQKILTEALVPTSDFARPKPGSWSASFNWTSTTAQLGRELKAELNRIIAEEASVKSAEAAPIARGILADIAQVKRDFDARENPDDPMPALSFDMPYAALAAACFIKASSRRAQDHLLAIQNSNMSPQQKLIRMQLVDLKYIHAAHPDYSDLRVEATPSFALHYQQLVFLLENITTSRTQIMQDLCRDLDRIAVFVGLSEEERDNKLKEKVEYYYKQIRESVNGSEGIFFGSGSPFGDALYYYMVNELSFEPDPERKNDSRVRRKPVAQHDSNDEAELLDVAPSTQASAPSLLPQKKAQSRSHTVFWRDQSSGCMDAPLKQIKRLFTCGGSCGS